MGGKWLEGLQEADEVVVFAPAFYGDLVWHVAALERLGLHFKVDLSIDVGRVQGDVPKPGADRIDVDA